MNKTVFQILYALSFLGMASCSSNSENENWNDDLLSVKAGDTVRIPLGIYSDVVIDFHANGEEQNPAVLWVDDPENTIFMGSSRVCLSGRYGIVKGLNFQDGYTQGEPVIALESKDGSNHAEFFRITACAIKNYSNPDRISNDHWIEMQGNHNRFDHNYIGGKWNLGTTFIMKLDQEHSRNNNNRIDSNYFAPKPRLGSNGGETIRVGSSAQSLEAGHMVLSNNYFDRCSGEVEIVSIKSSQNRVLGNVFYECEGVLAMRHGNGNEVAGNYFLGNDKAATGGVRVINADHRIHHNYFFGLKGRRFYAALPVMNGVPNSAINRYHQVRGVDISDNIFINCDQVAFGIGSDNERTAVPIESSFSRNLLIHHQPDWSPEFLVDVSGISFEGNLTNSDVELPEGFDHKKIDLVEADNGLWLTQEGWTADLPISKSETGPYWMDLTQAEEPVVNNSTHLLNSENVSEVLNDISDWESGDTLYVEGGVIEISRTLSVHKDLFIFSKGISTYPVITPSAEFEGKALIEILNGARVVVNGIHLKGRNLSANASFGISAKAPMLAHYQLHIDDCRFSDFKESRFAGIRADKGSFADSITVLNSWFKDFSGLGIALNSENDDRGRYNAEYVVIKNCVFADVMSTAIDVYRGGNDESTLGPSVIIQDCAFLNTCNRELGTAVRMIGVQQSNIRDCVFIGSGKSGRSIWFEDPAWADINIQDIELSNSGRIQTFYNSRVKRESIIISEREFDRELFNSWKWQ